MYLCSTFDNLLFFCSVFFNEFSRFVASVAELDPVRFYACGDPSLAVVRRINVPEHQFEAAIDWPVNIEKIDRISFMLLCIVAMRNRNRFTDTDGSVLASIDRIFDNRELHFARTRYFSEF